MQQNQPVRLSGIIDYIHELVFIFRHRNATIFWKIEEIVDFLFSLRVNTLHFACLVAYADNDSPSLSIGVSTHNISQFCRLLLSRFDIIVLAFLAGNHNFDSEDRGYFGCWRHR